MEMLQIKCVLKLITDFLIITFIYLLVTVLLNLLFPVPPFNHGYSVGYPAIYYGFYVDVDNYQYGIIRESIYINFFVILLLFFIYVFFKKFLNLKKNVKTPDN